MMRMKRSIVNVGKEGNERGFVYEEGKRVWGAMCAVWVLKECGLGQRAERQNTAKELRQTREGGQGRRVGWE